MWASEAPCSSISKNQMKCLKPGHHIGKILLFRTHHPWSSTTELILLRKTQKSSYFLEDIELFRPLWTGRWTQRGHFLIPQHESLRVPNLFLLFSAFFPLLGGLPIALPSKLVSFIFKVSSLMRFLGKRETVQHKVFFC